MGCYKIGGEYNLMLDSKKLKSGKCQIKFQAMVKPKKNMYGYVLAESGETLNKVIDRIKARLDMVKNRESIHHINLYSIGQPYEGNAGMVLFDA